MKTTILYVPGLGDSYDRFRAWGLSWWHVFGPTAKLVPITWYDGKSFQQKYQLVASAIEHEVAAGNTVVLIGESAGATLALQASSETGVTRVVTLCGVARPNTPVSRYLRKRAPALSTGVDTLPPNYSPQVVSIRAAIDGVVGKKYSIVEGAKVYILPSIGHLLTIVLALTLFAPFVSKVATKK